LLFPHPPKREKEETVADLLLMDLLLSEIALFLSFSPAAAVGKETGERKERNASDA